MDERDAISGEISIFPGLTKAFGAVAVVVWAAVGVVVGMGMGVGLGLVTGSGLDL
jgi:hypothetical protein